MQDLRSALKDSTKNGYVSVKLENNIETAVSVDKLVAGEPYLAKAYKLASTPAMQELVKEHEPVRA